MSVGGMPDSPSRCQESGVPVFEIRPASHATIRFTSPAPGNTFLQVEYWNGAELVARERRPVVAQSNAAEIKTPPLVTHLTCSLQGQDGSIRDSTFNVSCGNEILPIGRHFVVIGAMKAGTTTLFRSLTQHPKICRTWIEVPDVGTSKETNYFYRQFRKGDTPLHYDWRFPYDPDCHRWTLDVSPNYTKLWKSRSVPSRIATIGGEIKLAYILRDPVDRIESHMAHTIQEGNDALSISHYVRTSSYALHLDRFAAHFSRDNILLLDFACLRSNPTATMGQVCDFLGIDRLRLDTRIHNARRVKFKLDDEQRSKFAEALRPDIERLIDEYDFKPAEQWLENSKPCSRRRSSAGR